MDRLAVPTECCQALGQGVYHLTLLIPGPAPVPVRPRPLRMGDIVWGKGMQHLVPSAVQSAYGPTFPWAVSTEDPACCRQQRAFPRRKFCCRYPRDVPVSPFLVLLRERSSPFLLLSHPCITQREQRDRVCGL